jgi:DNA-binding transcriptional LysR family regulator
MNGLEVRELRFFVAVADELNFSRAADRLGMAQPPLSRAIRQLERRLGANLFDRDTRRVALTEFGKSFVDEARFALDVLTAVERRARRAALAVPTLSVTAKPGVATGMLRRVVDAYTATPGAARVEITVSGYREQADMIRDGRADAALLSPYFDPRGLDTEPLTTEQRVAVLPADHSLANKAELRRADLAGHPVPHWPGTTPAEHAYWSGLDPTTPSSGDSTTTGPPGPTVRDPSQLLEVVALGQAVALIPHSLATANPRPDIAVRSVVDATPYTISITWAEGARTPHLAQFIRTAIDLYQPHTIAS